MYILLLVILIISIIKLEFNCLNILMNILEKSAKSIKDIY